MICYENIVKNVVNVALCFFHNTFIFSCGWFQYDIFFFLAYKKLTLEKLWNYCDNLCDNILTANMEI